MRIRIDVEGERLLDRALSRFAAGVTNLRSAWPRVAKAAREGFRDWFFSNGGGTWRPLTPTYEKFKMTHYPFMPTMRRTDALYRSLTVAGEAGAVYEEEDMALTLGTSIPYARHANKERTVIGLDERAKREITRELQRDLVARARDDGFQVTAAGGFVQTELHF